MRRPLLLAAFALAALGHSQSTWTKVRVAVPDPGTFSRLLDTDLNVLDCHPHLGWTDVALAPGEAYKLTLGGFMYQTVGVIEDPTTWAKRHGQGGAVQADEYRTQYFNADQILAFFETLRAQYPVYVSRVQIGASINGEAMWAYRFGRPIQQGNLPFNNIVVQGLIHAREWVSGSVVMHVAKKCVDGLTTPQQVPFLPNQAVWIIPMMNPDGYRYTWTNNRLWRKNRRNNGNGTFGVDLNRNYSKGWGGEGSSGTRSSETYRGTAPFSEPETQAVRNLTQGFQRFGGFVDFHSYSQKILWPWSYIIDPPPTAAELNTVGASMESQMDLFGANYSQGQGSVALYIASGTSKDWAYDGRNIPSFTVELRDTGQFGFELPEAQIWGTQDEAWAGFRRLLTFIPR